MQIDTSEPQRMIDTVESALKEMECRETEGQFGNTFEVSIPCQLQFIEEPTQNTRRFHVELYRRGYADLDHEPGRAYGSTTGIHYDGEICSRDHYSRMSVRIMGSDRIRLYPKDKWDVTDNELLKIIEALEAGFGARLKHSPIDDEE